MEFIEGIYLKISDASMLLSGGAILNLQLFHHYGSSNSRQDANVINSFGRLSLDEYFGSPCPIFAAVFLVFSKTA